MSAQMGPGGEPIRVVRGEPTPAEIAALVAVLTVVAAAGRAPLAPVVPLRPAWTRPSSYAMPGAWIARPWRRAA